MSLSITGRRRGFTLIELMLAGMIMALVGTFGLYSLSRGRDANQSSGLANEIAEELKAARQLAIAQQKPVAIAFPGGAGCQAIYQLEGLTTPQVTGHKDYSETYSKACLFWGSWGSAQPENVVTAGADSLYKLSEWGARPAADPLLYFTPSGTVQSDGLPLWEGGEYRLLVSNGVEGEPGGPPAALNKPWTVRISKTGSISAVPGAVELNLPDEPGLTVPDEPMPIPSTSPPAGGLAFDSLTTEPKPRLDPASGAYTVVPEEGYITLVASVRELKGEAPVIRWEGEGRFSNARPVPMDYDFSTKTWVSRMAWTPPRNAAVGELFRLECRVTQGDQEITQALGAGNSVEVAANQRIVSVNTDGDWENFYVAWMNSFGTNVINLTMPDEVWEHLTPVWAPNGTKVAFYSGDFLPGTDPNGWEDFEATLYIVNEDGRYLRKLFSCVGDLTDYFFGPSFSPEGGYVAFSAYEAATNDASRVKVQRIFKVDDTTPYQLTFGPPNEDHTDVTWHPKENIILYTFTRWTGNPNDMDGIAASGIKAVRFNPDVNPPGGNFPVWDIVDAQPNKVIGEAHWSFDGRAVVYTDGELLKVIAMNPTTGQPLNGGAGGVDITPVRGGGAKISASSPRFAPDGDLIAVIDYDTDDLWVTRRSNPASAYKVTAMGKVYGYNWSPGGEFFVYSTWDDEQLYKVAADGSGTSEKITPQKFRAWSTPSWWSP